MTASTKIALATAVLALSIALATFLGMARTNAKLRAEVNALRSEAQLAGGPSPAGAANAPDPDELARLRAEHGELLRLKGEIGLLRQDQAELARRRAEQADRDRPSPPPTAEEKIHKAMEELAGTKMNFTVPWAQAFHAYAKEHEGKMPETFDQATNYLAPAVQSVALSFPTDDFEIVFRGALDEIKEPARTIILREKQPFNVQPSGEAWRTYLFADGHSEIHLAADGNFDSWEQQHILPAR